MKTYPMDFSVASRRAEIETKVEKLRAEMKAGSVDAVYINNSEHFAWITAGGDNIVSRFMEGGICAILITMTGRYFICNNIETGRMIDEELLDQLGFEERSMFWYESKTPEILKELVGGGKLASDTAMEGAADAVPVLKKLQRTLLDSEIARYVHLGKVFSEVIESYMATIRPGDSELEIAGRLGAKMWERGLEPVLLLIAADERVYKYRHAIPTEKKAEQMVMISCNARYKGLITKITRMVYFGKLPEDLKKQYRQTLEIENRIALMTRPGVDDIEMFHKSQEMYADFGYPEMWKVHHQGGPQSYTNGFYLITENSHEKVELGRVYGYNPSITGTKTEDAFVVTEDGPLFITYPVTFPKEVSVIDGIEFVRPGILEIQ